MNDIGRHIESLIRKNGKKLQAEERSDGELKDVKQI